MNWLDYQVNNFTRNYYNKSLGFIQLSYIERQQGYLKKKRREKERKKKNCNNLADDRTGNKNQRTENRMEDLVYYAYKAE